MARLARVSVSSVSLAQRGRPMTSAATCEHTVALARSLNHRIKVGAQNLRTNGADLAGKSASVVQLPTELIVQESSG